MDCISEKDCHRVMDELLKGKSYQIIDFALQPFSEMLGFHGSHALLKITAKIDWKEKEYKFFVKLATMDQTIFDRYFGRMKMYLKEHVIITKLMKELQTEIGKKLTSECYLSRLNRFMVLEYLNGIDYEVIRLKEGPDFPHAKIALQTFADLHASSILLERSGTYLPDKYPELLNESFFVKPDGDKPDECLLVSNYKGFAKWAEKMTPEIPANIREETLSRMYKTMTELVKASQNYKNLFCHGDPWGNNIMYRYEGQVPKEGIVLDFQTARYAPPAIDVIQFIYVALSKEVRQKHGEELKDIYYTRLRETLSSHGVDISKYLPRDEFDESCKVYLDFGISVRVCYNYITRIPEKYLQQAAKSVDAFLGLMILGDPAIPLAAAQDKAYKDGLIDAFYEAVLHFTGYSVQSH